MRGHVCYEEIYINTLFLTRIVLMCVDIYAYCSHRLGDCLCTRGQVWYQRVKGPAKQCCLPIQAPWTLEKPRMPVLMQKKRVRTEREYARTISSVLSQSPESQSTTSQMFSDSQSTFQATALSILNYKLVSIDRLLLKIQGF